MDELSGCGTGIKWGFENAKYQKGSKVIYKEKSGVVEECYHYDDVNKKSYIIRLDGGSLIDIKESELDSYQL